MKIAEKLLAIMRPPYPPPIESTRVELNREIVERRRIRVKTTRLAHLLADYRRQDGILK